MRVFSIHIIDEKLNFFLELFHRKNCMQKCLQLFFCEFYARKFAKTLQKFLLIRLNAVNFFRFSQLLVEVKNAKNEICIISDNSSNMATIRLKICTKQSQGKCLRILDTRSHLGWGSFLHGNPARPFDLTHFLTYKKQRKFHIHKKESTLLFIGCPVAMVVAKLEDFTIRQVCYSKKS